MASPPTNTTAESSATTYNPRWKGYSIVVLAGIIQFSAVANIQQRGTKIVEWSLALQFGLTLTLAATTICLLLRGGSNDNREGYAITGLTIYALLNVGYVTRVGGIAYRALNVYGGAWLGLAAAAYCLERWSAARDLLSWEELTGVSATLKSWYILLFASLVATWSGVNFWIVGEQPAVLAISCGALTTALAVIFICTHYKLMSWVPDVGWAELGASLWCSSMWIVATASLTQESGIGATIIGDRHDPWRETLYEDLKEGNCTVTLNSVALPCTEFLDERLHTNGYPGSNLYLSVWTCLLTSFYLIARWKAQQALQFAKAESKRKEDEQKEAEVDEAELDEFEDAEESANI